MSRRPSDHDDPTWYRIQYAIASQRLHASEYTKEPVRDESVRKLLKRLAPDSDRSELSDLERARRESEELVVAAADRLRAARWRWTGRRPPWYAPARWPSRSDRKLVDFLHGTLEPAAVLLVWSTRVEAGYIPPIELAHPPPAIDRRRPRDKGWFEGYFADLAFVGERPRPRWVRLLAWLGSTRRREPAELHYRVRYNLACLYSRIAVDDKAGGKASDYALHLKRSACHLEACFEVLTGKTREHMAQWAQIDPGLSGLRDGPLKDRFVGIVGSSPADDGAQTGHGKSRRRGQR